MKSSKMDFSIITPSYNMFSFLRRCVASVADQKGISLEHWIIDSVSTDGTTEWLSQNNQLNSVIEKDNGMYDGINRGFCRANGKYLAYLSCDEQYLPDTLYYVKDYFESHPETDILFGDSLVVDPECKLLAYRKGYPPRWWYIAASHLYVYPCSMFLRRRIVDAGLKFKDYLKDVGDQEFVVRLLRYGYRATHISRYLAAFTITGNNRSSGKNARREAEDIAESFPKWICIGSPFINFARLTEKLLAGSYYSSGIIEYYLYSDEKCIERKRFIGKASFRWPSELTQYE
jgi:glycosyltransferase involved in cell wall biosynthesis